METARPRVGARIAALITCYNRREKTLACLDALTRQRMASGLQLDIYLVDDGSQDGTTEAVHDRFPEVVVTRGSGALYWNGGMRAAYDSSRSAGDYDFHLWVNDDVTLGPEAIMRLLATYAALQARGNPRVIVAGAFSDGRGALTYGGVTRRHRWYPFGFRTVTPGHEPVRCETMNGNLVLIPRSVTDVVGGLRPQFTHAMADFDYGLRATAAGCEVWVAPGYVGTCVRNPVRGTWQDRTVPFSVRLKRLVSVKGLPPREVLRFYRGHGGPAWPLWFAYLYIRSCFRLFAG